MARLVLAITFMVMSAPVYALAEPGFFVSLVSGNTTEDGDTATFTVVLTEAPTDDVTIPVSSNDPSEADAAPASLVFNSTDWDVPQTVTATGVDDNKVDGDKTYKVVLSPATSLSPGYDGLDPSDVKIMNMDNDSEPDEEDPDTPPEDTSCFIATAAYGSFLGPEVTLLRGFRDRHLMKSAPGRAFVRAYYRLSPPVADFIASHAPLRLAAQAVLAPLVLGTRHPAPSGIVLVSAALGAVVFRKKKRAHKGK